MNLTACRAGDIVADSDFLSPVSAKVFARWITPYFDWLVTVDPHLHRFASLAELYGIPARAVHASVAGLLDVGPRRARGGEVAA